LLLQLLTTTDSIFSISHMYCNILRAIKLDSTSPARFFMLVVIKSVAVGSLYESPILERVSFIDASVVDSCPTENSVFITGDGGDCQHSNTSTPLWDRSLGT